ncbi:hypothetical protein EMIT019CA3_11100 [Bacillus pseudomycoides]
MIEKQKAFNISKYVKFYKIKLPLELHSSSLLNYYSLTPFSFERATPVPIKRNFNQRHPPPIIRLHNLDLYRQFIFQPIFFVLLNLEVGVLLACE